MNRFTPMIFVLLLGCPPTEEPAGSDDRRDCQANCGTCLTGELRVDCDDACLDLTESSARSFNRCAELTTQCDGVPECASTHLSVDITGLGTNNAANNSNATNNANNTNNVNNRPCLGDCIDNTDCDSSARCEVQIGTMNSCCKRGTRGMLPIGDMCTSENECTSGLCLDNACEQYCEFTTDCDETFICESMLCVQGEMICDDFEDNDLNGLTDCEDEACDGQPCDMAGGVCTYMDASCL